MVKHWLTLGLLATLATIAVTAAQAPDDSLPRSLPAPSAVCRMFLTVEEVSDRYYTVVKKEVQVGKKFYGSHDGLLSDLAKQANEKKAEAVIGVHSWRAPSGLSWSAAKTGGKAVRWTDEGRTAFSTFKGECWDLQEKPK